MKLSPEALKSKAAALRALRLSTNLNISGLLSPPESNPKIAKNLKKGVLTSPLHLAPASLSGYNVCAMATPACIAGCLNSAGMGRFDSVQEARIRKTKAYYQDRSSFMALLVCEIASLQKTAIKQGLVPGVRLNATSDIPWERVPFEIGGVKFPNLMAYFSEVMFYDYTKRPNRVPLSNYHLTFSLAENNDVDALEALNNGMNVAVVFDTKKGQPLPDWFNLCGTEVPVVDGDDHDYRPVDPTRSIVGLRAKGDAIGDTSGFVRPSRYTSVMEAA